MSKGIKCPYCGKSHYMEGRKETTLAYYPQIYKDDVNVNQDMNITTVYCYCLECNKTFKYKIQRGEIISVNGEQKNE